MEIMPTDRELEALKVLWRQGEASVREIYDEINASEASSGGDALAYTTVLSLLQVMEQKGLAGHHKAGKTYQYFAKIEPRSDSPPKWLPAFLHRVFEGAVDEYLVNALESRRPSLEELERLEAMIAEAKSRSKSQSKSKPKSQRREKVDRHESPGTGFPRARLIGWLSADFYLLATATDARRRRLRIVGFPPARMLAVGALAWIVAVELSALAVVCFLPFWLLREHLALRTAASAKSSGRKAACHSACTACHCEAQPPPEFDWRSANPAGQGRPRRFPKKLPTVDSSRQPSRAFR